MTPKLAVAGLLIFAASLSVIVANVTEWSETPMGWEAIVSGGGLVGTLTWQDWNNGRVAPVIFVYCEFKGGPTDSTALRWIPIVSDSEPLRPVYPPRIVWMERGPGYPVGDIEP